MNIVWPCVSTAKITPNKAAKKNTRNKFLESMCYRRFCLSLDLLRIHVGRMIKRWACSTHIKYKNSYKRNKDEVNYNFLTIQPLWTEKCFFFWQTQLFAIIQVGLKEPNAQN